MKIMVTGDRGYIGAVLVSMLKEKGHEVIGYDSGYFLDNLLESYELKRCMNEDLNIIIHTLGEKFLEEFNQIKIDEKIINNLEDKILSISLSHNGQKEEWEEILYDIKKIKNKSIYHYLSVYPKLAQQLATSLNKSIHPFEINGDKKTFLQDNFKPFINSLIHVFRNCCDHGIETKEKRIELHKNEIGNINCEFKKIDNNLSIIISDDGQGIDIDRLKEKIINKKLCSKEKLDSFSTNEIINFIFNSNLSTNDNVTQISGRGIGLSAVNEELIKINGIVEVKTKINEGTKFIFTIPLDPHLMNKKEQCSLDFYNELYTKHKLLLKYIAQGEPLSFILDEIIKSVESRNQNMICSILVLDKTKQKLLKGAAPSLPSYYNDAISGMLIGEKVGSCGAAAFLKERVIVDNINTHENWKFAKKLANKANLHACWSQPLFSSNNMYKWTFLCFS